MRPPWALLLCLGAAACGPGGATQGDSAAHTSSESGDEAETDTDSTDTDSTDTDSTDTDSTDEQSPPDVPQEGPPCEGPDVLEGDHWVYSESDAQALEGIRCITGDLSIISYPEPIPDLEPLWALEVIGGVLRVGNDTTSLDSLNGLTSLTSVGGLHVAHPPNTALDGLETLELIGAAGLVLDSFDTLTDVDGLSGVTWIDGDLRVRNVGDLSGLASLTHVSGELWITNSPQLTDLDGLASVVEFDHRLVVGANRELVDIGGLAGLPAATEVYVFSNPKVSTCAVLDLITGLQPLEHSFMAGNDDAMCQPVDPCAPMDAHAEGPCEAVLGPFWFGQSCGHSSGCTCSGKDCVVVAVWAYAEWWQEPMLCEAAFASCM